MYNCCRVRSSPLYMFLKIGILKILQISHVCSSLLTTKLQALFLKNAGGFFCWVMIETIFFSFFVIYNSWGLKKLGCMIFLFSETSMEIFCIITKWFFLLILFSIHFRKFQRFCYTSRSSYGQILPGNGESNQAWEVHHEVWKYSCDQGATTIEVSMGNFHTQESGKEYYLVSIIFAKGLFLYFCWPTFL